MVLIDSVKRSGWGKDDIASILKHALLVFCEISVARDHKLGRIVDVGVKREHFDGIIIMIISFLLPKG